MLTTALNCLILLIFLSVYLCENYSPVLILCRNIAGSFVDDMKCDDCLKSALKQITDKLATIVAMNYSSAAATLNQVVESTIISELPNIMARWVVDYLLE